ncbi:chemotaxis protein CheX [Tenuibacillus multivorans]|uniref:Chemotaxis protein CheX n=1 Tax=Tenuibacillus multivorans TaxID=237069 RepID=A0A1H0BPR3_9BACI|nr:chemotaxis protein CheX [Tenuibacillus multivorans]GEL77083.1 hypothetical protein TMU01_13180 [Tenuibacillus multivorans]SDN47614.1 chemotaxis protein CheX [Tenuibacillus multivorans]
MTTDAQKRTEAVTYLLNGTLTSIQNVIPMNLNIQKPNDLKQDPIIKFGVLIGITGDIKGKLILSAQSSVFSSIGESMYGMKLEGEMLTSFSGELGNMIAGGISTINDSNDLETNITAPTIMEGNTTIKGYEKAIQLNVEVEDKGEIEVYLLLD